MRNNADRNFKSIALILAPIFIIFFDYEPAIGQTNCAAVPVPYMFEKKDIGDKRKKWFSDYKYKKLCDAIGGKSDAKQIFYYKEDFQKMISHLKSIPHMKYIHVHFASYKEEGSPSVPINHGQLMTLIFAPADKTYKDIGDYYYTLSPLNKLNGDYKPFDPVLHRRRYT